RCHRSRIEIHENIFRAAKVFQVHRIAVLVRQAEGGCGITDGGECHATAPSGIQSIIIAMLESGAMRTVNTIVVLTGAGISAESGIRTFRASDGLWENHRIEDVATPE